MTPQTLISSWIKPKPLKTSRHRELRSKFLGEDKKRITTCEVLEIRLSETSNLDSHVKRKFRIVKRVCTSL